METQLKSNVLGPCEDLTYLPFTPLDVQVLRILVREALRKKDVVNWRGLNTKEICERLGIISTIENRSAVRRALNTLSINNVAYSIEGRWFPSTKVIVYLGFEIGRRGDD